jgi:hypothetical protein
VASLRGELALKARLALVLVAGFALAAAPEALADNPPTSVAPADAASFTARVDQLTFQARPPTGVSPAVMDFYISTDSSVAPASDHGAHHLEGGPTSGDATLYQASPDSSANWPFKPGTYYWQAVYDDCTQSTDPFPCPNEGPIRTFTIGALAPPTLLSPASDATIPFGGQMTFSLQDAPSYTRDGTALYIEFARGTGLASDGTFAHPLLLAKPVSAGGGTYEYHFTRPFTNDAGTYHWIVERFDCSAEPDCYVTNPEIRSFTVATPPPPPPGHPPNTFLSRHPQHRTHKRKVKFAFTSNAKGASFQCFYTGGWAKCRSPQIFRHLKPGRYRFKVRAVAGGKKDRTPAIWLFKVVRRHHHHHHR